MRKFACLLVVLALMVSSTALAEEILFRDIPWGSSIDVVSSRLGIPYAFDNETSLPRQNMLPYYVGASFSSTNQITGWMYTGMFFDDNYKVGGYVVDQIHAYCAYGRVDDDVQYDRASSRFYAATYQFEVNDIKGAYDDLKIKLTKLYGSGEDEMGSDTMFSPEGQYEVPWEITTWLGDDNTSVMLSYQCDETNQGNFIANWLRLTYGRTDFDEELNKLDELVLIDKMEEEQINRSENTDGL